MPEQPSFNQLPERKAFYFDPDETRRQERRLEDYEGEKNTDPEGIQVGLKQTEVDILEEALRYAVDSQLIALPPKLRSRRWFEILHDPAINNDLKKRYRYLHDIPRMVRAFRPPKDLQNQFNLPRPYKNASFQGFDVLCEGHTEAMAIFTGFGPAPQKGLYLVGEPGTGKTHIMAAFARGLRAEITANSFKRIGDFALGAMGEYEDIWVNQLRLTSPGNVYNLSYEQNETVTERLRGPEGRQLDGVMQKQFDLAMERFPFHTTDIAYAYFEELFKRYEEGDSNFLADFVSRRIVIVDDIQPHGRIERLNYTQSMIEDRYHQFQSGATFFTSNLPLDSVLSRADYPEEMTRRGRSRLKQMCFEIPFEAGDYREKLSAEADSVMREYLERVKRGDVNGVAGQSSAQTV